MATVTENIEKRVARGEIRAAVLGLYRDGEITIEGFGQLGRDDERLPDGSSVFEIGSVSKIFTALLAQRQVDAGRATWDQTLAASTDIEFADSAVGQITWQELATHSSGLPRLPDNMNAEDPLDPYAGYGEAELFAYLSAMKPAELNKTYEYSNLGMGLLGVLAAQAAGLPYHEALRRDVFAPLELNDTAVKLAPEQESRLAQGFSDGADMPRWGGFDALAGAGAVLSTVDDMLRFASQNLAETGDLAAALGAIRKPTGDGAMGRGWHINDSTSEAPIWWHNGGTGGYASTLALRPATAEAVVLLTASTDYDGVTRLALAQLKGESPAPAAGGNFDAYVGAYEAAPGMVLTFFVEDNQLFGQATGQGAFPLTPGDEHQFTFAPADIAITFDEFGDDKAQRMVLLQAGRTTRAPRVADEKGIQRRAVIPVPADRLADFEGQYQLTPLAVIDVEARDGQLFARLTGQAAFPVFPFAEDEFFYKVVDAELHFERDDAGAVTGVTLVQGGRQFAPRKNEP
ncbi:MAG: serine hydrolase [Pseudomonadota bacterium]